MRVSPRGGFAVLLVVVLAVVPVVVGATSASAHDQLVSTNPSSGEVVATAPAEVTLVFAGDLLEVGSIVLVNDSHGRNWAVGPSSGRQRELTQELDTGMPDGGYQVRWQVVSGDGHPISGFFDFSIGAAAAQAIPAPESASADRSGAQVVDLAWLVSGEVPSFALTALIGAAGGVAIFTVVIALRSRRRSGVAHPAPPESDLHVQ